MTRSKLNQMSILEVAEFCIENPTHELAASAASDLARLFGKTNDYTNERIAKSLAAVGERVARIEPREIVR